MEIVVYSCNLISVAEATNSNWPPQLLYVLMKRVNGADLLRIDLLCAFHQLNLTE